MIFIQLVVGYLSPRQDPGMENTHLLDINVEGIQCVDVEKGIYFTNETFFYIFTSAKDE